MGEAGRAESSAAYEEQERIERADTDVDFRGPAMTDADLRPDEVQADEAERLATAARHLARSDERMVEALRGYLAEDGRSKDASLSRDEREEARKSAQNNLWDFKRHRALWEVMRRTQEGAGPGKVERPEGVPESLMPDDADRLEAYEKILSDGAKEMERTWKHYDRFRTIALDERRPEEERAAAARSAQDFLKEFKDAKAVWELTREADDELASR